MRTAALPLDAFSPRGWLRLADGRFDCQRWRSIVRKAARLAHPGADAICPFGFELTGNPSFLQFQLRRFYVYAGLPEPLLDVFAHHLLEGLREECPDFAESIHGIMVGERASALRPPPGPVLHLIARPPSLPLVKEWARYLLAAPGAAARNELGEVKDFARSKAARSYVFQLALMFHHLLEGEPGLDAATSASLRAVTRYDEIVDARGGISSQNAPATVHEISLLRRLVGPQLRAVARLLARPVSEQDKTVRITVRDFHSADLLASRISEQRLASLSERIETSYERYR